MPCSTGRGFGPVAEGDPIERDAAFEPVAIARRLLGGTSVRRVRGCRPAAAMEMPVCWKSVHSWAMRMMGCETRWANMLKATNMAHGELAPVHDQVRAVPKGGGVDQLANEVDAFVCEGVATFCVLEAGR